MKLSIFASGSSGNAVLVFDNDTALLFDAGISAKRICDGLKQLGLSAGQLDGICIPHPALTPEFQAAGLPAQRIFPTGIPIRRQFCQTPDRDAARRQLELEGCRHVFTLACGSMGAGPLRSTAACIACAFG